MKKLLVWGALWAAFSLPSFAQEGESSDGLKVNLGVAVGYSFNGESETNLNLRHQYPVQYYSAHAEFLSDFLPARERVSFSAGLRITCRYASMLDMLWDDIYWLVNEEDKVSDYVSVRSLSQRNFFLGVPLAFRVFFNSQERRVRPYLKLDVCPEFLVSNVNDIDIRDEHMKRIYGDQIEEEFGKPNSFHASASAAIGIRIYCKNFYVTPEFVFPTFEMVNSPVSFLDRDDIAIGVGSRVAFLFPIGKKNNASEVKTSYSSEIKSESTMPSEDF